MRASNKKLISNRTKLFFYRYFIATKELVYGLAAMLSPKDWRGNWVILSVSFLQRNSQGKSGGFISKRLAEHQHCRQVFFRFLSNQTSAINRHSHHHLRWCCHHHSCFHRHSCCRHRSCCYQYHCYPKPRKKNPFPEQGTSRSRYHNWHLQ